MVARVRLARAQQERVCALADHLLPSDDRVRLSDHLNIARARWHGAGYLKEREKRRLEPILQQWLTLSALWPGVSGFWLVIRLASALDSRFAAESGVAS